jgi:hypothetical protein
MARAISVSTDSTTTDSTTTDSTTTEFGDQNGCFGADRSMQGLDCLFDPHVRDALFSGRVNIRRAGGSEVSFDPQPKAQAFSDWTPSTQTPAPSAAGQTHRFSPREA